MEENILHYNSVIESADKYNGKQVSDLIDKGSIFQMIKRGYRFDDEVLKLANITKTVHDHRVELVVVDHEKDTKKYKKDTATLKEIIKEIDTLEYDGYDEKPEINNDEIEETDYAAEIKKNNSRFLWPLKLR